MDAWDHQPRPHRHARHRKQTPSFSSSLLDAIYRSIDDSASAQPHDQQVLLYTETMRKKQSSSIAFNHDHERRRACMIEKWMEKKKVTEKKVVLRRTSMADFDRKARNVRDRDFNKLMNSSSSSSESSSGSGGFSSSESESVQRSRPIRAEKARLDRGYGDRIEVLVPDQKPKHENGFVKTKAKAIKMYGDLKKVKQPNSPGGRLATFLNSIFNAGSPKKQKLTNSDESCIGKAKSAQGSVCSSASSFSRSCLSKAPSTGSEKLKRTVRFCPVSVILDEDSRPCGHRSLREELGLMAAATRLQAAEEASQDHKINDDDEDDGEEDEEDEDAMSCSSSDLFELDNLSTIGIERYCEELPVYETTHFTTNQAIANGSFCNNN